MTAEVRQAGFLSSRAVRYFVIGVGILIVLVALVLLGISLLKSSHSQPIAFDVYPGAKVVGTSTSEGADVTVYVTQDSIQKVYDFYLGRMPPSSDNVEGCQKIYLDKTPSEAPGHWFGGCMADNSVLNVQQSLSIKINYQTLDGSTTPQTVIEVRRNWGGS
jgi:hypothetical protein